MSEREPKSAALYVRVTPQLKLLFEEKALQYKMQSSDLMRELVVALIEGRITVAPPEHVKEFYRES